MKKRRYWDRIVVHSIGPSTDLRLHMRKARGQLETFSLVFKYKIDGEWRLVKRCDNSKVHDGVPHCHIYKASGDAAIEIVGDKNDNMGIIAAQLVKDIRENQIKIVENYKHSK